jgi:hypothetical protein
LYFIRKEIQEIRELIPQVRIFLFLTFFKGNTSDRRCKNKNSRAGSVDRAGGEAGNLTDKQRYTQGLLHNH